MSPSPDPFSLVVRRAIAGCQGSAGELHDRFGEEIIRRIRLRFKPALRGLLDPEDVYQETWLKYYAMASPEDRFETPEQCYAYLSTIARNCLIEADRHYLGTGKRCLTRNISLHPPPISFFDEPLSPYPDPQSEVETEDLWEWILGQLLPSHREIARHLRDSDPTAEIADAVSVHQSTVRRVRAEIARLHAACGE